MLQGFLRHILVVEKDITREDFGQVFAGTEVACGQDLGDTTIEALDHAVQN